jgi:hypothetical protein
MFPLSNKQKALDGPQLPRALFCPSPWRDGTGLAVVQWLYGQMGNTQKGRMKMADFKYKQQYAVVVMCKDEKDQENVYTRLKAEGYTLKVVAV